MRSSVRSRSLAVGLRAIQESVRSACDSPREDFRRHADCAVVERQDDGDEAPVPPEGEPAVVPGAGDPTRLAEDGDRRPGQIAVEVARPGVREEVEQVLGLGRHEPAATREPSLPHRRLVDVPEEAPEVPGARPLPHEARLLVRPERNRPRGRDDVPAVHVRVGQAERTKGLVDAGGAGCRRASEPDEEVVRRPVVRRNDHPPQQRIEPAAVRGRPSQRTQDLDRDRHLERRGGRELRPCVPRGAAAASQVLDEDRAGAGEPAREPPQLRREPCVFQSAGRRRPRLGRPRQPEDRLHRCRPAPVGVHRGHRQADVALRERDVQVEGPAAIELAPGRNAAVDGDDERLRGGAHTAGDPTEGDLVGRGSDEDRRSTDRQHRPTPRRLDRASPASCTAASRRLNTTQTSRKRPTDPVGLVRIVTPTTSFRKRPYP